MAHLARILLLSLLPAGRRGGFLGTVGSGVFVSVLVLLLAFLVFWGVVDSTSP